MCHGKQHQLPVAVDNPLDLNTVPFADFRRRLTDKLQLCTILYSYQWAMQLLDALEWCLDLGITCVSVYAFSIENFRRSSQEVEALMNLAEQKLAEMLQVPPAQPPGDFHH